MTTVRTAARLLKDGRYRVIYNILRERIYSTATAYCLECLLDTPLPEPDASLPFNLRICREGDIDALLMQGELYRLEPDNAETLGALIRAGLGTCYIAADGDKACFMQLVIDSGYNRHIPVYLGDNYPDLKQGEALLEGAFTVPGYRGRGLMPATIARIANLLRCQGIRRLVTFVYTDNTASLKAIRKAGFEPRALRTTHWRLFRRKVTFSPLPRQPARIGRGVRSRWTGTLARS